MADVCGRVGTAALIKEQQSDVSLDVRGHAICTEETPQDDAVVGRSPFENKCDLIAAGHEIIVGKS